MSDAGALSLRAGHRRALGLSDPAGGPSAPRTYTSVENLFSSEEQRKLLSVIPPWVIKKSWFALAHLLLEPGATVVDLGCRDGTMTYTMSVLAPTMHIIGVDKNPESIAQARETYQRPNLEYREGDIFEGAMPEGSADAIIANLLLHEIFSSNGFNERLIRQTLRQCQRYLKPGGLLFIRDFAEPLNPDEIVLMEMPDQPSRGNHLEDLSEPDLLLWYSEFAAVKDDPARSGFFLEELPPRFPKTRLFRLPAKWAYEFIMRKDMRAKLQDELPKEYTFFNEREYHKTLNNMGLRVLYSAPHWDEVYIGKHFDGHFRLLDENGTPMGTPPTSFVVLAQKVDLQGSLALSERRKTKSHATPYHVTCYRNEATGGMAEIVSRDVNLTEIIPFSIMAGNRLVVYLHEGAPRGIVNAVPRNGRNLDGKYWSGHLTEAIAMDTEMIHQMEEQGTKSVINFIHDALGLNVAVGQSFVEGPGYYPNPRYISERVETRFIAVEPVIGRFEPRFVRDELKGFSSTGKIRAFDAQSILNAISVGVIPSGYLEIQLQALFTSLEIDAMDWAETPMVLKEEELTNVVKVSDILKKTSDKDKRYKQMRGSLGKIRIEQSIFVDEGIDDEGTSRGLAARDIDFVVNDDSSLNVAVILPLSRQHSGEVMAGLLVDFMPVPQRYVGDGTMATLPTLPLPKGIQNMDMARKYIAEKFEIKPEQVSKMGEPYFTHIGVTPQRIFPFAINAPSTKMSKPQHGVIQYTPLAQLNKIDTRGMYERFDVNMVKATHRAYKRMAAQNELNFTWKMELPLMPKYSQAAFTTGETLNMSMPLTGRAPPVSSGSGLGTEGGGLASGGFSEAATTSKERGSRGKTGSGSKAGSGGKGSAGGRAGKPKTDPSQEKPKRDPLKISLQPDQ